MYELMDGCMYGWMDGWMDGWMFNGNVSHNDRFPTQTSPLINLRRVQM